MPPWLTSMAQFLADDFCILFGLAGNEGERLKKGERLMARVAPACVFVALLVKLILQITPHLSVDIEYIYFLFTRLVLYN